MLRATTDVAPGYGAVDLEGTYFTVAEVDQSTSDALVTGELVTVSVKGRPTRHEGGFAVAFTVSDRGPLEGVDP